MTIKRTTATADAVLAYVEMLMSEENVYYLLPYQNGREHGYCLTARGNDQQVAFAQNRGSDDIVVYYGKVLDFDSGGYVPLDRAWDSRLYFKWDAAAKVAQGIIAHLSPAS
jgi:hypothetical protein